MNQKPIILTDANGEGLTGTLGTVSYQSRWQDIKEVTVWSQDLVTVDRVSLVLWDNDGEGWVVDEDQPLFEKVLELLPQKLSGIRLDPITQLRSKAFSTDLHTLWP